MRERPTTELELTLIEEEILDRAIGLRLIRLRIREAVTIEELARRTGFLVEELRAHESGSLPLPVSRIDLLALGLGKSRGALIEELIGPCAGRGPKGCPRC